MLQMINGCLGDISRHDVHLVMKVAGDSRVYKRQTTSLRPPQCIPVQILSGFVRACSRPRIIRDTCRLLPPSGIWRASPSQALEIGSNVATKLSR